MQTTLKAALALIALSAIGTPAYAAEPSADARATYDDIKATLGVVPDFLRQFPEEAIGAVWSDLKGTQLNPRSAIPGKYKELIALGVAAQVPCRYCTYFHTRAAQLGGASERETREAVVMASIVRKWSTVLNGLRIDEAAFSAELDRIVAHIKRGKAAPPVAVTDAASAYRDIEATLGLVPSFLRGYPEAGIAGAWRELKTMQLSPTTAISPKYKELIGLGVSSQIPCRYCTVFHTVAAKLNGATDAEIREAVGMAAMTRHWSTFLNGMMLDETTFRRDTDAVIEHLRRQAVRTAKR